jgi:uncharacterized protein YlxW (UPF0749 family)
MSAHIPTWWQRLGCTWNPGSHTGEESARDAEIADLRTDNDALRARIAELEAALKDALVSSGFSSLALEQSAVKLQQADDYIEKLEAAQPSAASSTAGARDAEDAARWRTWLPWMRNLNKKPFNLAKEISKIDSAATAPMGEKGQQQ